jgi:hypothetical protein
VAGSDAPTPGSWFPGEGTALLYDAPLVTHNRSDYLGMPGLNPISREL